MSDTRCYMIVLGAFTDFDRFMTGYQVAVEPVIRKFGGTYALVGHSLQMLEGEFPEGGGLVLSVWPDRAAALRFWHSPEYATVRELRAGTGTFQVVLVDGPVLV